jgi:hypothetical protein
MDELTLAKKYRLMSILNTTHRARAMRGLKVLTAGLAGSTLGEMAAQYDVSRTAISMYVLQTTRWLNTTDCIWTQDIEQVKYSNWIPILVDGSGSEWNPSAHTLMECREHKEHWAQLIARCESHWADYDIAVNAKQTRLKDLHAAASKDLYLFVSFYYAHFKS